MNTRFILVQGTPKYSVECGFFKTAAGAMFAGLMLADYGPPWGWAVYDAATQTWL